MKKILFTLFAAMLFTACSSDKGEAFFAQWEGEYVRTESFEIVYADGSIVVEDYSSVERPFYIFQDKSLYVQTYGIGDPFVPGEDSEEHVIYVQLPKRTSMAKDSIDVVDVTPTPFVVLQNGGVYTYYNGRKISPNPIEVQSATADQLILKNGANFEVDITNAEGTTQYVAICHWEYSPLKKQNELYTCTAELHIAIKDMPGLQLIPAIYRHNMVIHRKQ